jgi:hypothetical protein
MCTGMTGGGGGGFWGQICSGVALVAIKVPLRFSVYNFPPDPDLAFKKVKNPAPEETISIN